MLKRTVITTVRPLLDDRVYTVRHGLARGLKRRGGLGFLPQLGGRPKEELFLEALDLAGKTVYDVGAFEGVFSMFFARRVGATGRLITFEPNPQNWAKVVANLRLNGFQNVEVRELALGAAPGVATLVFPPDEAAFGSLVGDIQAMIRRDPRATAITVQIDSIDRLVAGGLPEPDFVKIDVEGFELDVLRGMAGVMARRHPTLYVEVHGADMETKLANATAVTEYLWLAGYVVKHVESGQTIDTAAKIATARRGHLYCV